MGMMAEMGPNPDETSSIVERLRGGDRSALGRLFELYRDRLHRMVDLRMDSRLRARLDASDVLQEAYMEIAADLDSFLADGRLTPLLWMRLHVGRRLITLHRQHLGVKMRDAG